MQSLRKGGAMHCWLSGGTLVGIGIRLTASFRLMGQIVNAPGSMPIFIGKRVIFRMQLIGTDDPVTQWRPVLSLMSAR
jgi:hypothetical protein